MTPAGSSAPNAIDWENLLNTGLDLLNPWANGAPPTGEHIRRAISSAYYAMSHALSVSNADALIGAPRDAMTAVQQERDALTEAFNASETGPPPFPQLSPDIDGNPHHRDQFPPPPNGNPSSGIASYRLDSH